MIYERIVNGRTINFEYDQCDHGLVSSYKWHIGKNGYPYVSIRYDGRNNKFYLHRMIMSPVVGTVIDHVDGNKLNNKRSNLRICSQSENMMNQKVNSKNKHGVNGVSYRKDRCKFRSYIKIKSKTINLGTFKCVINAILVRTDAEKRIFGKFSRLSENP